MSNKTIIAIDQSLTSTGVCVMTSKGQYHTHRIQPKVLKGLARLDFILTTLNQIISEYSKYNTFIVIEDYAYSLANQAARLGELGGIIKYTFFKKGYSVNVVNIKSWKKHCIGNGNASKKVIKEFFEFEHNHNEPTKLSQDEIDAFFIAKYWGELNGFF